MTRMGTTTTASMTLLPADVRARAQGELEPGEHVVWVGQPVPRLAARGAWVISVFAVPWTAFAVFWMVGASHAAGLFGLFGIPFVAIGIAMFFAPAWMRRAAAGTVYLLTERRAVIVRPALLGTTTTVRSYRPAGLGAMTRRERSDGSGDLIFEQYTTRDSDGDRRTTRYGFMAVERVRELERLVQDTLLTGTGTQV